MSRGAVPAVREDGAVAGTDPDPTTDGTEATFTVEELAAATGLKISTIRYYQHKRVLPPPERHGRVGIYRRPHLERLELIAELQDRGLRLDAIREAVKRVERGDDSLTEWLGVSDRLTEPWTDDAARVVTDAELRELLRGRVADAADHLERAGVLERRGEGLPPTWVLTSPGLLDLAMRLDDAGIDPATSADATRILRRRLGRAASDLLDLFVERRDRFGGSGAADDTARAIEALRPVAGQAVQLIFAQEVEKAVRRFVESGEAVGAVTDRDRPGRSGRGSDRRRA